MSAIEARASSLHPEQLLEMARRARLVQRTMGHLPTRERLRWNDHGLTITMGEQEEDELDEWPSKQLIGPPVDVKIYTKPDGTTGTSPKVPTGKGANSEDEEDEVEEKPLRPVIPMTLSQPIPGCQVSANSLPPEVREALAAGAGFVGLMVERHRTNGSRRKRTETRTCQGSRESGRGSNLGLAERAVNRLNKLNRERPDLSQNERARLAWLETFPATISLFALRP